jgi:transposase
LDAQIATLSQEIQHALTTLSPGELPVSPTAGAGATSFAPEVDTGHEGTTAPLTFTRALTVLDSIPGVHQQGAELLVAEWGIDMERFGTAARLAAWRGVAPGNKESAGIQRSGKTRKGNRALRTGLVQRAHAAAHTKETYLSALYHRLAARRGKKRAILAVAHSIVVSAFHLLSRNEPYRELGSNDFDEHRREHLVDRLTRRIERLGYQVALEPMPTS